MEKEYLSQTGTFLHVTATLYIPGTFLNAKEISPVLKGVSTEPLFYVPFPYLIFCTFFQNPAKTQKKSK
jgi:hypothetical protein